MSRRILVSAGWLLAALGSGLACGCVERTYTILTVPPPGAPPPITMVLENGHEVGPAPVTRHFRYYGKYRFEVIANGYQTQVVLQPISAPWYEYFPLDFITENLVPWTIRDHRVFTYTLEPAPVVPAEIVRDAAERLRAEGRGIGKPLPPRPGQPVPPPGVVIAPPGPTPGQLVPPGQPGLPPGAVQVPPALGPQPQPQPVPVVPGR